MKIIILGAGQVGASLAERLADEENDITVIDIDSDRLHELQDRLDIGTVAGCASHPDVLLRAGADDADLLIAVTNTDEINMVACQVAYSLFRTPTKISRIRSQAYLQNQKLFSNDSIPIDVIISPELLVTRYIHRLIKYPGALQVLDFAGGKVQLVAVKAYYGGPIVGNELREIRNHMPNVDTRVAAIFRRDHAIMPAADLPHFQYIPKWLPKEGHSATDAPYQPLKVRETSVAATRFPLQVILLRRQAREALLPYMIFLLTMANCLYQIELLAIPGDQRMTGTEVECFAFPTGLEGQMPEGQVCSEDRDLSSDELEYDEPMRATMTYTSVRETK